MEIEREIVELLMNLIRLSKESESLKQLLNQNPIFEPYAIFTRIERFRKNSINQDDIVNFLKDSNHFTLKKDYKEIQLFIEHYDNDCDSNLNFEEFLLFVLNKTNPKLRATSTQRKTFKIGYEEFLPSDLENLIAKLFLSEIKMFNYADKKKLEIHLNRFDYLKLFLFLDFNKDGFISVDDIADYLRTEHDIVLYKEEINSLIALYDKDSDNKLNWEEYLLLILPSKLSYEYDYSMLRDMENEYTNIFYESIRREKLKKERKFLKVDEKFKNCEKEKYSVNKNFFYNHYDNMIGVNQENLEEDLEFLKLDETNKFYKTIPIKNELKISKSPSQSETVADTYPTYNSYYNKFSFLSESENNPDLEIFVDDLNTLLKIYIKSEKIKINLAMKENFNLIQIFKIFDRGNSDNIRFVDFIETLEYFKIIDLDNLTQINQAELVFKRFDKHNKKKLSYSHFIEIFMPKSLEEAMIMSKKKKINHIRLSRDVKDLIKELFSSLIEAEIFLNQLKIKYNNRKFRLRNIFESIDVDNNGFITLNEFMYAFRKYKIFVNHDDLILIMDRFDRNKDGKISVTEFYDEFI